MSEYSNQTLEQMIQALHEDVREIKTQTTLTNGRVNKLEIWRGALMGSITVVVFVLGYIINYFIK